MVQKNKARPVEVPKADGPRRETLLDEAAAELNERGVTQTSLNEIAVRLGLTRTALYYYVDDQRDLVFQCYRRSCEVLAQRINRAKKECRDPLALLDHFIDQMLAPGSPQVAVISELSYLDTERREIISGLLSGIVADLSSAIDRGVQTGLVRPCRSDVVASSVLGLVSWPTLMKRADPEMAERVAPGSIDAIKSLLRFGVAANRQGPVVLDKAGDAPADSPLSQIFERNVIISAKQEALLAAGSALLNAKGADLTSLDEIAASVGVSKAVIYHNIGDKQTFLLECYRRAHRIALETVSRMEKAPSDRLSAFASAIYRDSLLHMKPDGPILLPMVGFAALPEPIADELRKGGRRLLDSYRDTLQAGCEEGSFRKLDYDPFITLLPSFSQWLANPYLRSPLEGSPEDIAEEIAKLISTGLAPARTQPD